MLFPLLSEHIVKYSGPLAHKGKQPESFSIIEAAARKHHASKGVQMATTLSLWGKHDLSLVKDIKSGKAFDQSSRTDWVNSLGNWNRGIKFDDKVSSTERRRITGGETQYFQNCVTCHGADAKGVGSGDQLLAPSLADSKRMRGDIEKLIPLFINGLVGPIDGKSYQAAFMPPAHALGITRDDRLAELISYLRYVHGNKASSVSADDVKRIRKKYANRKAPWTDQQLNELK